MSRLVSEIVKRLKDVVQSSVMNLHDSSTELRIVFHGPPLKYLRPVFDTFSDDGDIIQASLPNGELISFPVVLQVDHLPSGTMNPVDFRKGGLCDESHLLDRRNNPSCSRFVALVPPNRHRNQSVTSASSDRGLLEANNSGASTIQDWWGDEFIQDLVESALSRTVWSNDEQREQAKRLIKHAFEAADVIDRHVASRERVWGVMSRIWSISDSTTPYGWLLSLACGFPPIADGSIHADEQIKVLQQLADVLAYDGFKTGIERLKQGTDTLDFKALDQCLQHLQKTCDIPTVFARGTSDYYGPVQDDKMIVPPEWWTRLTVEKWTTLLDEEVQPEDALVIECTNPLFSTIKGLNGLVQEHVELKISLPEDNAGPVDATVIREVSGSKNRQEWNFRLSEEETVIDNEIPLHKSPARYTVQAVGLRAASLKIVSLKTWEPGVYVFCRSATKITAPKKARASKDKHSFETNLSLSGQGRHYIDIYVRSGVTVGPTAVGKDANWVAEEETMESQVTVVSEYHYGFEVEATAECHYDLTINRGDGVEEILRLNLSSDETAAEGCKTEFERLIRLNRQEDRRATTDVQIDRHLRCFDLESWILDHSRVDRSYFPIVLAPDYASRWVPPEWRELNDTVFSNGRFLCDPRPTFDEMQAPEDFKKARVELAKRIRQSDGSGLVESAELGRWLSSDPQFEELIEQYVRTYLSWLDADPNIAVWSDLVMVTRLEADGKTLVQEPDAILVSPFHPLRLAWHCIAQRAMYLAYTLKAPCFAASILDPDSIPDALSLPLRTATGSVKRQVYFAVDCSSDYWAILWNGTRLQQLVTCADQPPFDQEFGVRLGGVSSGFSVSQVQRALDDVSGMLSAKPILNIVVSSAAGQNNACNEGLFKWCGENFQQSEREGNAIRSLGPRLIQIFDDRQASARPEDSEISNLAEDTGNAIRWFNCIPNEVKPDLGIIAQLEISNSSCDKIDFGSPLGIGALIRHRIRGQLKAAGGAFLSESRMGIARPPSGDGLSDKVMAGIVRLENLGDERMGYTFAPSVHAIENMLEDKSADFAAVSSSAIDPACFLGGWLKCAYLWDYDLPSYSHRAGDINGYYLLSHVKEIDLETLRGVLSRLPECNDFDDNAVKEIILEVAKRGIPTVRGLSGGDSVASGDLGLFVAGRILQDEFRVSPSFKSLLPVLEVGEGSKSITIVIPVDPFRRYIEDLQRGLGTAQALRPDLIVACIVITDSAVRCKLTPIEVKYRGSEMTNPSCKEALQQAQSLSKLIKALQQRALEQDMLLWKLGFQHLLISMLSFGFRVYSQQAKAVQNVKEWTALHQRFVEAVLSEELQLEVDGIGRLVVIDNSPTSVPRDIDDDGFKETIVISLSDAGCMIKGDPSELYQAIRGAVGDWGFMPTGVPLVTLEKPNEKRQPAFESPNTIAGDFREPKASIPSQTPQAKHSLDIITNGNTSLGPIRAIEAGIVDAPQTPVDTSANPPKGIDLLIGKTIDVFRPEEKRLNICDTKLNQLNIGVVGDLGTGKTQLLKSLIFQITKSVIDNQGVSPRFLIFDYKKDYSSDDFVNATSAKVIKPYHLPINLFDMSESGDSPVPWLVRFKFFADVLDKIHSGIGAVQRANLKRAVRQSYDESQAMGRQPTIYDVHRQYRAIIEDRPDTVFSIIDDLVDQELFSPEPTTMATTEQFLNGVVVISLDALGQDDKTKNMLVAIMLNIFYEHMLKIPKRMYVGTEPQLRTVDSFLLVDEADNIMRYEFDVLRKILLQGREFGVGVILASQYLSHFKVGGSDYKEPLLTWFIHKVPNIMPQELAALGLPAEQTVQLAARVKSLALHQCLYKTHSASGDIVMGIPFYQFLANQI